MIGTLGVQVEMPLADPRRAVVVNVSAVPHLSVFRYPGGKTWLVPTLRRWLLSLPKRPQILVEPFLGGGIISLTAVTENLVDTACMVELDYEVAAVWQTILSDDSEWLAQRVEKFSMSLENARGVVESKPTQTRDIAFRTIVKNRTLHGGIIANGSGFLKHGDGGKGVSSRWYPETLAKRIRHITKFKSRLNFIHGDAFEVIQHYSRRKQIAWFVDPPYTAGGKKAGSRLYTHAELDHELLFERMAKVKGELLITYDNAAEVKALANRHGFETKCVPMKSTHHAELTELLIGNNLTWL